MEGTEKPHMDKYKEITNDWNYDSSCTLTSLPVWELENLKCLIFIVWILHSFFFHSFVVQNFPVKMFHYILPAFINGGKYCIYLIRRWPFFIAEKCEEK
jgi:hypothetical protein